MNELAIILFLISIVIYELVKRRFDNMPVHKTSKGWKYGKTGKIYKSRKKALRQGRAIAISKKKKK